MIGLRKRACTQTAVASDELDLSGNRHALMLSFALSSVAIAAPPPATPAATDAAKAAKAPVDAQSQDDSLFEFLGSDDVGDTRTWEYLLKNAPRSQAPPQASAPEAKS